MGKKKRLDEVGFGIKVKYKFVGLRRHFLIAPFSVLRPMSGEWMKRKRMWLALGIKSEVGRGGRERERVLVQEPKQVVGVPERE